MYVIFPPSAIVDYIRVRTERDLFCEQNIHYCAYLCVCSAFPLLTF